jgi:membrane-associated protease RseP (regulator of RpoE activity)
MNVKRIVGVSVAAVMLALPALAQKAPEAKDVRRSVIVRGDHVEVVGDADGPRRLFVAGGGGYLGISPVRLTDELRAHFGAPTDAGVIVGKIFEDTPAAKAGLKVGDIVIQVDGKKVESTFDITRALSEKKKGDPVRVDYVRNRTPMHAFVTLDERRGGSTWTFQMPEIPPIHIDGEHLEKAMEGVRVFRNSPEARARVFALGDCDELQTRIKELESRLKELEKRLK